MGDTEVVGIIILKCICNLYGNNYITHVQYSNISEPRYLISTQKNDNANIKTTNHLNTEAEQIPETSVPYYSISQ